MRYSALLCLLSASLLVSGCDRGESEKEPEPAAPPAESEAQPPAEPHWNVVGGFAVRAMADGTRLFAFGCARPGALVVHAPSADWIASEERFSFGLGEEAITMAAKPAETGPVDGMTGGVVAEIGVPQGFAAMLERASGVNGLYGQQPFGPFPAPGSEVALKIAAACEAAPAGE